MKRVISLMILLCTISGHMLVHAENRNFIDVNETHWAYSYIAEMVQRGVVNGYADGEYKPDRQVTRAEFAKMLLTVAEKPVYEVEKETFSDVKADKWYATYVESAKSYLSGYEMADGNYYLPDEPAKREDIAVALVKIKGYMLEPAQEVEAEAIFSDYASISSEAKKYVAAAVKYGVISGYEDGTFRGQKGVTRAEAAALLSRAYSAAEEERMTEIQQDIISGWSAGYYWTVDGEYCKVTDKEAKIYSLDAYNNVCATPESDPIMVESGERYSAYLNCYFDITLSDGSKVDVAPILITDDNGNVVWALKGQADRYCDFTVPYGGTRLYISYFNNQNYYLRKLQRVEKTYAVALEEDKAYVADNLESNYESYKNDGKVMHEPDKAYVIFTIDDCRKDMDVVADIFETKKLPLCIAAIPGVLKNCASDGDETRLDVCRRVVNNGGEILVHYGSPLTIDNYSFDECYERFAVTKNKIEVYGFDVNGIILAGGTGQNTIDFAEIEKWSAMFYEYSDLYGNNDPYKHRRINLKYGFNGETKDEIVAGFKERIEKAIETREMISVFFHDTVEVSPELLEEVLDYLNTLSKDEIEVVTYKTYYSKFYKAP